MFVALLSFMIVLPAVVRGRSMLLVNTGRAKCMTVEVPGRTVIRVSYEAPGTYKGSLVVVVCFHTDLVRSVKCRVDSEVITRERDRRDRMLCGATLVICVEIPMS